jgi:NitT/TauT family transport system ATP-binding protein
MHKVKAEEPFTGVLITHDLRESIFLADEVIVLSGRPARTQYRMKVHLTGPRDLEHLYTPESADALNILRHQIQIAQGRAPSEEAAA